MVTNIVRSDIALDKQKGCKIAQHPDIMLELQREKAAQMHLVLLKEQFSNTYSNLTLTARSLDKLYNFADCSGLHLIFALNALRRNPNNSWNSSNALSLLKYSASKKYNISWELGNEPNNYRTLIGRSVNGSQLGKDYIQLRSLLQLIRTYSRANLYGPNIGRPRKNVIALLEGFMKVAGSAVDAVTWQHYYIDGRVAKVTDFLKTRLLDTLSDQIRKIQKVRGEHVHAGEEDLAGRRWSYLSWRHEQPLRFLRCRVPVAEHAGLAGQPGHRRGGAALLPRPRAQPSRGSELQPAAGLLAVPPLQAPHRPQGAGDPRGRPAAEAPARQGHPRQAPHLRPLHQLPQPQLCPRVHHPLHHQPASLPEENQAGRDAAG
ncbi:PREDICTED: inactive heparanase-2-like [Tinamus guttatus]|uniref:inactive heparanase-2-like n=1 Tax=Tinamus guttatus TaxID=94827 RepID=UPI00052E7F53|nr:PREDICTED: inactive heparanase-2-like [Tinamus guttatus]